ncbi:hypothetical protein Tco_0372589, partial [Tanacetum coccineum]
SRLRIVGRSRRRNFNLLHDEPDPQDIEVNELRQLIQQLQLRLECVRIQDKIIMNLKIKILKMKNSTPSMLLVTQNLVMKKLNITTMIEGTIVPNVVLT